MLHFTRTTAAALLLALAQGSANDSIAQGSIRGHDGEVWSVAFSPDGQLLATAGEDATIGIWSFKERELVQRLAGHSELVRSVAFSPDGQQLASAGFDQRILIWGIASGDVVQEFQDSSRAFFPRYTADGRLVTASEEPSLRVWDLATGELDSQLGGHTDRAWVAAVSPDGRLAASGSRDGTARVWALEAATLLHELRDHAAAVTSAAFSPDGNLLATGSGDTTVKLWHVETGQVVQTIVGHSGAICELAFSPDGEVLATVTRDGIVRLWAAETGLFLRALKAGGLSLAFSPDGSSLATGGADGEVDLLDWQQALDVREGAVDLAPAREAWGLGPRGQGGRNTCSVFVATAVLEHAASQHLGQGARLSPEYLNWACNRIIGNETEDRGQFFHHLLTGFEQYGICREEEMPYADAFDPDYAPSDAAQKSAEELRELGLQTHWINPWGPEAGLTDEQLGEIKGVLDHGSPVAAGSGHSVLLVGYIDDETQPGGGTFLVVDSGGPGHYNEMTYAEAQKRIGDVFWVE